MNYKTLTIDGTLSEVELNYVGKNSDFPILKAKISTGEKFYEVEAAGSEALANSAILSGMPIGTPVSVQVQLAARRTQDGLGTFNSLQILGVALNTSGTQGGRGTFSGYVQGVETKGGKNGDFKLPLMGMLLADRDGVIPNANIQLSFPRDGGDEAIANWEGHTGQAVTVEVVTDAYISEKGRSYPRYTVRSIEYSPLPEYMNDVLGVATDLADAV